MLSLNVSYADESRFTTSLSVAAFPVEKPANEYHIYRRRHGTKINRVGLVSSFSSQTLSLLRPSERNENTFDDFQICLDTYGLYTREITSPGIKLRYLHNTILKNDKINDSIAYIIYMGAGATVGYVRDYSPLPRNHGYIMGMALTAGCIFAFKDSNVELGVNLVGELAFHLRSMEEQIGQLGLSWYANGIFRSPMPQISIYYKLK